MKKSLAILMALTLLLTFSACGKKDTATTSEPAIVQEENENSTVALMISINPQFTLYINKQNTVTKLDFMNDDAKSLEADINYENVDFQTVIKSIISACRQHGFIENEATVKFEIPVSAWNDNSGILNKASTAVQEVANELAITLTVEGVEPETLPSESNTDETASGQTPPPTTAPTTSKPSNSSTSSHRHNLSEATCTTPPTCSAVPQSAQH